jgi:hypothetical protein
MIDRSRKRKRRIFSYRSLTLPAPISAVAYHSIQMEAP